MTDFIILVKIIILKSVTLHVLTELRLQNTKSEVQAAVCWVNADVVTKMEPC